MERRPIPALLTVTYMHIYADKMAIIKEVIENNLAEDERLQKIGSLSIEAEQLQPVLFAINYLEIFVTQMENEDGVYESGRYMTLLASVQKKIAYHKNAIARPFSEAIYSAMKEFQKSPAGQLDAEELNNYVLLGEGGVTERFYKLRGSQLEACLASCSKANLSEVPQLLEAINALLAIDTTQPAPLVKQELKQVMEKLTILI